MDKVYGANVTYAELQDEKKLEQVYDELMKLPYPRIDVRLFDVNPAREDAPRRSVQVHGPAVHPGQRDPAAALGLRPKRTDSRRDSM